MKLIKKILPLLLISFLLNSCDEDTNSPQYNLVDSAALNSELSTFILALQAADGNLLTTLGNNGPYTILAPTNSAFSEFLLENGFDNINQVPSDVLEQILLNHVISADIRSNVFVGLGAGYASTNADGPNNSDVSIYFNTTSGIRFNGVSTITTSDIVATNGTLHIVDKVIDLPTVMTFIESNPNFSALSQALTSLTPATDFSEILSRTEDFYDDDINPNFTLLAPNNAAFSALSDIPAEPELTQILLHHVVTESNLRSSNLTANGDTTVTALNGDNIIITLPGTGNAIANVTDGAGNTNIGIVGVDIQALNGVIHTVNVVLLPSN